jgi:hypothetical protein
MPDLHAPVPEAANAPVEQAPPVATDPIPASRPPLPWEVESPAPDQQDAQPVVQQAEPETAVAPTPSEPSPTPAYDPQEVERLKAQAAQFEQLQQAVEQEKARLAREAEQQQRDAEFQRRADEIWDIAQRFDSDEERRDYYRKGVAALQAETAQFYRQTVEQERQQLEAERMAQAIAGYPDWLGKEFQLDAADVEDLRQLSDFNQMTATAKSMKRMKERYAEMKASVDQTYAAVTAQKQQAVLSPGAPAGAPTSYETPKSLRSGTRESRQALADIFSGT